MEDLMGKTTRKYVTKDGDYLVAENLDGVWRIWWHIAEWDEDGGCVGEVELPDEPPKNKDEWEEWQADRCVRHLADGRDETGFYFEGKKKAQVALKAANEGLFSGEPPWPAWALQAKDAGWKPPKGWKP